MVNWQDHAIGFGVLVSEVVLIGAALCATIILCGGCFIVNLFCRLCRLQPINLDEVF